MSAQTLSTRTVLLVLLAVIAQGPGVAGCTRRGPSATAAGSSASGQNSATELPPPVPFELRRDSTDLRLFWFDEEGIPHEAARVDEVPEPRRERVRVDPARPELRAAGWIYLADLRAPGADGRFAVRAVPSEQFAQELATLNGLARLPAPAGMPSNNTNTGGGPGGAPSVRPAQEARVVIYGASWCGACHQAADYLRANNIPFIERDIEREPDAARDMMARAREQGVPTGSIPIIDVNGRLLVGFNPDAIQRALHGG